MSEQNPPATPEPAPPPPRTPQQQNSGCGTALAVVFGIILLLPGACVLLLLGAGPGHIAYEEKILIGICLAVGAFGVSLIVWAIRRS